MAEVQLSDCKLRVATYNVHDCVGRDGTYAPDRIAAIVADLQADLVALQEITLDHAGDVVTLLERNTRMQAIDGTLQHLGRLVGAQALDRHWIHNHWDTQLSDLAAAFLGAGSDSGLQRWPHPLELASGRASSPNCVGSFSCCGQRRAHMPEDGAPKHLNHHAFRSVLVARVAQSRRLRALHPLEPIRTA